MKFIYDDGGRKAAGRKGDTGDCVTRAIAIATGLPYAQVYDNMAHGNATQRITKRSRKSCGKRTASHGISVRRQWFKDYMTALGWKWTPTMGIGTGCTVHLKDGELPMGRLIVSVSKHYVAVIDGVIRDTYDPSRDDSYEIGTFASAEQAARFGRGWVQRDDGKWVRKIGGRCVYGYWSQEAA